MNKIARLAGIFIFMLSFFFMDAKLVWGSSIKEEGAITKNNRRKLMQGVARL